MGINAPNCVRTNDNPSRNPNLLHNDLNVVHKISLDKLDARNFLTTSPIPTVSALTIDIDKKIDLLNINLDKIWKQASSLTPFFVEEKESLQETSGVPSSEPRRCTDNLPSLTIGIDSSAPSPEPKHLLKLQLDSLFSMTVDYGLHHHHQCESVTIVKEHGGPFIDSSFDPSHSPINYPSITCPSFVPSGDPFLVGVQICIYLLLILN